MFVCYLLIFGLQLEGIQSIVAGNVCWLKCEPAAHIASAISKWRVMKATGGSFPLFDIAHDYSPLSDATHI